MAQTEAYKGLYAMHKYWGKKPFEQINSFIEKYSQKDDVVLDCFCGSGVTLIETIKANRKAIGIDLNPIAIKLARASISYTDISLLKKEFDLIKKKLMNIINSMYVREYDGKQTMVTHIVWKNGDPIEVWYSDDENRKKIREGDDIDRTMTNKPSLEAKWYPTSPMFENSRINVNKNQVVSDLFTKRALVGLSLLLDEIKKVKNDSVREALELTLTGTLSQASKLVFVIRRRGKNGQGTGKAEVGSWVIGYWVPKEHFEINVWNCFENRFRRILKGKEDVNSFFSQSNGSRSFDTSKCNLINCSATEMPLFDNSIDYVFIDPPHSNRILYMEQSLMWNSWLQLDKNIEWDKEIVVSEAKKRNKNLTSYTKLMDLTFKEIQRVLKEGKMFSFAFNSFDDQTWIDTLNLFINNGFEVVEIYPLEYSATSVVQDNRKNALKTDFVFTCKNAYNYNQKSIVLSKDLNSLCEAITRIKMRKKDMEVYEVVNELFIETIPRGFIYSLPLISSLV